jgi:hypothetical protein
MAVIVDEVTPDLWEDDPRLSRAFVRIFDDNARECGTAWEVWRGPRDGRPVLQFAVDDQLRVLVLFERYLPFRRSARWFTLDGRPLTEEFSVAIPAADCIYACVAKQGRLVPLIGGGVAYQEGQQYLAVFPGGEPRHEPPPAWLAEKRGHILHRARGGYVFVPYVTTLRYGSTCAERISFVSADGEDCGTMRLDDLLTCPLRIDVGRDGTVLQLSQEWNIHPCRFSVWDKLLADTP